MTKDTYSLVITSMYQGLIKCQTLMLTSIALLCCVLSYSSMFSLQLPLQSKSLYYPKTKTESSSGDFVGCFYWATAIVTFLFNTFYTAASAVHPFSLNRPVIASCILSISDHTCKIPSDASVYEDEILTVVGKLTIIPIAVFIELLLPILAANYHFTG